jgi:hypothetical protein
MYHLLLKLLEKYRPRLAYCQMGIINCLSHGLMADSNGRPSTGTGAGPGAKSSTSHRTPSSPILITVEVKVGLSTAT